MVIDVPADGLPGKEKEVLDLATAFGALFPNMVYPPSLEGVEAGTPLGVRRRGLGGIPPPCVLGHVARDLQGGGAGEMMCGGPTGGRAGRGRTGRTFPGRKIGSCGYLPLSPTASSLSPAPLPGSYLLYGEKVVQSPFTQLAAKPAVFHTTPGSLHEG